jgi:DNA-binding transcriptional ArsR family regulator
VANDSQPTDAALTLLDVLRDGLRLRILLALEREPMAVSDLAATLDLPYSRVNWAVQTLKDGGLILQHSEGRGRRANTVTNVLMTPYRGWAELGAALDAVASSVRETD